MAAQNAQTTPYTHKWVFTADEIWFTTRFNAQAFTKLEKDNADKHHLMMDTLAIMSYFVNTNPQRSDARSVAKNYIDKKLKPNLDSLYAFKQELSHFLKAFKIDEDVLAEAAKPYYTKLDRINLKEPSTASKPGLTDWQKVYIRQIVNDKKDYEAIEGGTYEHNKRFASLVKAANFLYYLNNAKAIAPGSYMEEFRELHKANNPKNSSSYYDSLESALDDRLLKALKIKYSDVTEFIEKGPKKKAAVPAFSI